MFAPASSFQDVCHSQFFPGCLPQPVLSRMFTPANSFHRTVPIIATSHYTITQSPSLHHPIIPSYCPHHCNIPLHLPHHCNIPLSHRTVPIFEHPYNIQFCTVPIIVPSHYPILPSHSLNIQLSHYTIPITATSQCPIPSSLSLQNTSIPLPHPYHCNIPISHYTIPLLQHPNIPLLYTIPTTATFNYLIAPSPSLQHSNVPLHHTHHCNVPLSNRKIPNNCNIPLSHSTMPMFPPGE